MIASQKLTSLCRELQRQYSEKLFDLSLTLNDVAVVRLHQELPNENTGYDIGCIQTLIEGLVIVSLADSGAIDVDAHVGNYLPELSEKGFRPGNSIRVLDLLSHSTGYHAPSGIPEKAGFATWREMVDYLSYTKPAFPPGVVCSWNVIGRTILLRLVERATGVPLDELAKRNVAEVTGRQPRVLNVERGCPTLMVGIDDLSAYVRSAFKSEQLGKRLRNSVVPVVRNPISARSSAPVGYAFGLALYPDGLWGQTGNDVSYNLGLRFDDAGSFCLALAIGAPPFTRDLALQYLCTACGFVRRSCTPHVMGSTSGCELHELSGIYVADQSDEIRVSVAAEHVTCSFSRNKVHVANVQLKVEGELLVGDGRWDTHQIEFFRHPEHGGTCLTFGQISYARTETNS